MKIYKTICLIVFLIFYYSNVIGQCELETLKPTKDAQVWSFDPTGEFDRGTDRSDIVIYEWTKNGFPTTKYGMIEFDLSSLEGVTIDSALISLFYDPESIDPGHSKDAGSNEFYFYRLLGPWEESVSWNQVPLYTENNAVLVPETTSSSQNYIDLDITELVQDMLEFSDSNFGLLMKLRYTDYYRSLVFASSEHPDENLHPTLRIVSSDSIEPGVEVCNCGESVLLPNLSRDFVKLSLNLGLLAQKEITIYNVIGQQIETIKVDSDQIEIDVSKYSDGYYFLSIPCEEQTVLKFAVTKK